MPIGWSGYPNGQIPLAMMTQLSPLLGVGGYAQPDAAAAFLRMAKDFEAAVGLPLKFSEFYRPITIQEELFTGRYVRTSVNTGLYWQGSYWTKKPGADPAAVPGTSNHGYAIAVDFAWPLTSWTTQGQQWFRANEARYGFSSAQGVADGEPWHKVYVGPTPTTAGGGSTPINQQEEDPTMWVVGVKNGLGIAGAVFTMGREYIRHEPYAPGLADQSGNPGSAEGAGFTTRVVAADDKIIWASQSQFNALLSSFDIPADSVAGVLRDGGGRAWSRSTQIAAKLGAIPSEFVKNTY